MYKIQTIGPEVGCDWTWAGTREIVQLRVDEAKANSNILYICVYDQHNGLVVYEYCRNADYEVESS